MYSILVGRLQIRTDETTKRQSKRGGDKATEGECILRFWDACGSDVFAGVLVALGAKHPNSVVELDATCLDW